MPESPSVSHIPKLQEYFGESQAKAGNGISMRYCKPPFDGKAAPSACTADPQGEGPPGNAEQSGRRTKLEAHQEGQRLAVWLPQENQSDPLSFPTHSGPQALVHTPQPLGTKPSQWAHEPVLMRNEGMESKGRETDTEDVRQELAKIGDG